MTASVRTLITALVLLVAVSAGALYVGYRRGLEHAGASPSRYTVASLGGLSSLFGQSDSPSALATLAFRKLETSYYRPVNAQAALHEEDTWIDRYLRSKRISDVRLPGPEAITASTQPSQEAAAVLAYAQQHYGEQLGKRGSKDLTQAALGGILASVDDPYTVYLSPREIQGLQESLDGGDFGGIGVYIYRLKNRDIIVQPIEGMPAARAGMTPGEVVDTINGKSVAGLSLDHVEQLIRGAAGSTIVLSAHMYREHTEHRYRIVREVIHVPTVNRKMEDGYDYIRLSDFGETSAAEIKRALLYGKAHHARGYILDLRDNGGGLLDAAVAISSYFIAQGTIVSTIDRRGTVVRQQALGDAIGGLQPLVILVNKYTASASEITAGALQDYRLATLIGTRTFGKGVVQSIYPMPNGGALKITTASYLTPLGRDIEHKGIEPNIVVNQKVDPALIDTPADKQLAAAKTYLQSLQR
jgi:carboxyl-terminal processing protease